MNVIQFLYNHLLEIEMKKYQPPNTSEKFQKVYRKYFEMNGDPKEGIKLANKFLKSYPFYSEALVFKARMLIVLGRYKKAIKVLETAEKYDRWRLLGKFDKAEAYLEIEKTEEAIIEFTTAIISYQNELQNGIEYFLSTIADSNESKKLHKKTFRTLSEYWQNPENGNMVLNELKKYLAKRERKIKALK